MKAVKIICLSVITAFFACNFVLAKGLVAWWKFDENKGGIANDSAGNCHGMVNGPLWAKGKFGSALRFNDSENYVSILDAAALRIKDEITIEFWIFPEQYSEDENRIICKPRSYNLDLFEDVPRFQVFINGHHESVCGEYKLPEKIWHHLAATYNSKTGLMQLYVNGDTVSEQLLDEEESREINVANFDLWIGATETAPSFFGIVDEIKIYDTVLSRKEIKSHSVWR